MKQCDNKCAHGCSNNQNLVRIQLKDTRVMVLNLCSKGQNEYKGMIMKEIKIPSLEHTKAS